MVAHGRLGLEKNIFGSFQAAPCEDYDAGIAHFVSSQLEVMTLILRLRQDMANDGGNGGCSRAIIFITMTTHLLSAYKKFAVGLAHFHSSRFFAS
jgi:hypothetical protein